MNIRNVCMIAHIDHGKTSLTDHLISYHGFISNSLAGKIRYLDNTEYEQEKGITIKSSCITLKKDGNIINLIDCPGHVDFSSEVSISTRISDGGILLIDVLEGIKIQTMTVLSQAYKENIKICLCFNKMDRLILELKLKPKDAYLHICKILQQINALMSGLIKNDLIKNDLNQESTSIINQDENNDYFNPLKGNVIFSSAFDGWAFRLNHFSKIYSEKLKQNEQEIYKKLWSDGNEKKIMFVDMILENIWNLYNIILNKDIDKIKNICKIINIELKENYLKKDRRILLQFIMSQWLPIGKNITEMIFEQIPNPLNRLSIHNNNSLIFVSKMILKDKDELVAFSRIYNGSIEIGQTLFILLKDQSIEFQVKSLYELIGKDYKKVDKIENGMIFGIGGIQDYILKTCTISNKNDPSLILPNLFMHTLPIMKIAIEPVNIKDLSILMKNMKLLNQLDPSIDVFIQDTGENILMTTGEVHTERCIKELKDLCTSDIPLDISDPLVSFRETIINSSQSFEKSLKNVSFKLKCYPLPFELDLLEEKKKELKDNILSFGLKTFGNNLLVSKIIKDKLFLKYENAIINGFQLATSIGPLCNEPMMNICFLLEEAIFDEKCEIEDEKGTLKGSIISIMKDLCIEAFNSCDKRLVEAFYKCEIQVHQQFVGKVYPVLNKRRAKIISEDYEVGTDLFIISSYLPVSESLGFASELRSKTHGAAVPQLLFSHWKILDIDPFAVPTTEDEIEEFGDSFGNQLNLAKSYIDQIRKRKGLFVKEKIVEQGEKQRTLSKK